MQYSKEDYKLMENMANSLEGYLETLDNYMIIRGISKEEKDHAVKVIRKLIKRLRKGQGDKVFDEARFREAKMEGKLSISGL